MGDFPLSVFPDFRAGGAVMRFGVHRIFVLIRIKRIWNFARKFRSNGIIAARIFRLDGGRADDYFRAESFQQINLFARLLVGNSKDDFVATHASDEREPHAGVAGSPFDDGAAWLQLAGAFGFVDHRDSDTIFHRAAGIHVVGLYPNFSGKIFGEAIQADDGRVAHRFEDVVALHWANSLPPSRNLRTSKSREFAKMWQGRKARKFPF